MTVSECDPFLRIDAQKKNKHFVQNFTAAVFAGLDQVRHLLVDVLNHGNSLQHCLGTDELLDFCEHQQPSAIGSGGGLLFDLFCFFFAPSYLHKDFRDRWVAGLQLSNETAALVRK